MSVCHYHDVLSSFDIQLGGLKLWLSGQIADLIVGLNWGSVATDTEFTHYQVLT